jgi:hypothetical protein
LQIEQYPPKKPNFLLVVVLAGGALLLILVLAYFFIDFEGSHLHFRHRHANANAQVVAPASLPVSEVFEIARSSTGAKKAYLVSTTELPQIKLRRLAISR